MKKIVRLLMMALLVFSLVACGSNESNNEGNNANEGSTNSNLNNDVDLDDVDEALDLLESLQPEGWSQGNYGGYIYDVYDSEFLPDCFPSQVDGTLAYMTKFKDYKHDVMNQDYSIGELYYDSYEDYRCYSVSFYTTSDQLSSYIQAIVDKGMYGYMEGEGEGFGGQDWRYGFYAGNGWAMSLFYNPNDNKDGEFDGCVTVNATQDLFELPKSINQIPLPQKGITTTNQKVYTIQDFSNGYEDVDFDMVNGQFPDEYYAAWVDYFGYCKAYAQDYVTELQQAGWAIEYEYANEEDLYWMILKKDNIYANVKYEQSYLQVGFSDMIENFTY